MKPSELAVQLNALDALSEQEQWAAIRLTAALRDAAALRALCREAGDFYAQGGTFPINGEMSKRLRALGGAGE